jgi:hypothetical protein
MLYPQAVTLFKAAQYWPVICKLILFLENESLTVTEKGTCYSTMASCYRELEKIEKAIAACQKAVSFYELANQPEQLKKVKEKLARIRLLEQKVTPGSLKV